jgi:hypothetical protein
MAGECERGREERRKEEAREGWKRRRRRRWRGREEGRSMIIKMIESIRSINQSIGNHSIVNQSPLKKEERKKGRKEGRKESV